MRRSLSYSIITVLIAPLLVAGCGREARPREELARFIQAMKTQPRSFVYKEKTKEHSISVAGTFEDDLRQTGILKIGNTEVLEHIVSDDTLAVRVIDPSQVPAAQLPALTGKVGDTIRGGGWVLDYAGAPPPLAPKTREGVFDLGKNLIIDSFYVVQYVERAISEAAAVQKFNPDSTAYIPAEDPFPTPEKGGSVVRYDLVAPPLPRRSQRGSAAALPTIANFRKMAFYIRDGKVIRILEDIDPESHRDFKRARQGKGPQYPLQLLAAVRAGRAREPIRPRSMSYEVANIGKETRITLPPQFLAAPIAGIFGPSGFANRGLPTQPAEPASNTAQPAGESGSTSTATASS